MQTSNVLNQTKHLSIKFEHGKCHKGIVVAARVASSIGFFFFNFTEEDVPILQDVLGVDGISQKIINSKK